MCLDTRFKPEVEKKMIAKLPGGLITVYKITAKRRSRYIGPCRGTRFRIGLNCASTCHSITDWRDTVGYQSGYHSFTRARSARKWWGRGYSVIKFQIRKGWITAIGKQDGCIVYVTDRIISPSLRDKSAIVE